MIFSTIYIIGALSFMFWLCWYFREQIDFKSLDEWVIIFISTFMWPISILFTFFYHIKKLITK